MSLPIKSINEILAQASKRHKLPSLTAVEDLSEDGANDHNFSRAAAAAIKNKVAGSAMLCLEYSSPSEHSLTTSTLLGPFPNEHTAQRVINQCATLFLHDVVSKMLIMTEYCYRLTVHPADVARALELLTVDACGSWYRSFPSGIEAENEDEADDAEGADENWKEEDEAITFEKYIMDEDDTFLDDESDSEEEDEEMVYIDETKYDLTNTNTPLFDKFYPPLRDNEICHLSTEHFKERLLLPTLEKKRCSGIQMSKGVDIMLKRAMYRFLVAKIPH